MDGWKMRFLLGFLIFRGYVKLRGGTCNYITIIHLGVSLNGGTPISHPKCWSFLVGKPHGFVGETHHFWKPPSGHDKMNHEIPWNSQNIQSFLVFNVWKISEKHSKTLLTICCQPVCIWDPSPMYGWDATLKEAVRLHVSKANLSRRRSVPPADEEPRSQEATFETRVTCNSHLGGGFNPLETY